MGYWILHERRRPRENGDPVALMQKTLDSRFAGMTLLRAERRTFFATLNEYDR
jgi:hypothetical protein